MTERTERMTGPLSGFQQETLSADEIAAHAAVVGPLADSVRALIDAVIRTEVDDDEIRAATKEIEALTARLARRQMPGPYGVLVNEHGRSRAWGNAVMGLRNAIAPPVEIVHEPDGRVWAEFSLGAPYEGPAGLVHGGVSALILDQILGEAASAGGRPGMTGTLQLRYRKPTPLGRLYAEAKVERADGLKTIVRGTLSTSEHVCVEAEGIFVLPRWARELIEARGVGDA